MISFQDDTALQHQINVPVIETTLYWWTNIPVILYTVISLTPNDCAEMIIYYLLLLF